MMTALCLACYVGLNIMNRLLSVVRSMTDKSVELSRALQMALFNE